MKVNEIFYSIQGESSFMGLPCAFIRLSACDLRCTYCDTGYAFYEGKEMEIAEILSVIEDYPTRLALVTGGEPMLQKSVHALFRELLEHGYTVCLETGGHVPLKDVDPRIHKIVDLKCPSSGMESHNNYENINCITRRDEIKFVVGDRADFDWACDAIRRFDLTARAGTVLFSPVYRELPYHKLARWVLDSGLQVRMQLQLHKIIWPDILRGV
ncbi:MAG TPA: radical SAM protein [Acidobacteriota bacterium]|nr:radical SAM protein [Acidobacteriota bacterium]